MSFKSLPKSLIDSVTDVVSERNLDKDRIADNLLAQGLRKFGVKRVSQLAESDHKALVAWVQTKLDEACSCGAYEDHMPGDDALYNDQGDMKKDLGEEGEASDVVKAELEKMGKTLGELSPEEKKALFNKVDSLVKAKNEENEENEEDKEEIKEAIALDPDEIATNKAVAIGSAMLADPVHADVIKDSIPTEGRFEYRLLLQYATGGEIYLGAPYEGTHIYPPMSMPGATTIEMLRDMIEGMPFYNKVVEKALKNAVEIPSTEPRFKTTNQVTESKKRSKKK